VPAVTGGLRAADILLQFTEKQVKHAVQAMWDKVLPDAQQAAALQVPCHPECPGDQILLCTYVTRVCACDLSRSPLQLTAAESPLHSCNVSARCAVAGTPLLSLLVGSGGSHGVSGCASFALLRGV
jgi:hypothetical protein